MLRELHDVEYLKRRCAYQDTTESGLQGDIHGDAYLLCHRIIQSSGELNLFLNWLAESHSLVSLSQTSLTFCDRLPCLGAVAVVM